MGEDANAQYYLGLLYRNGWEIEQDDREAAKWMRLAAHQDLVEAQYVLGYMYQHGQAVSSDIDEAKRWYRMAAKAGDADAQQSLAIIYYVEVPILTGGNSMTLTATSSASSHRRCLLGASLERPVWG